MRFGLLAYKTDNVGDDIQSIAARAHIPDPDYLIDRDLLAHFEAPEDVKVVCNGWYSHYPANWPPAPKIKPLLVSMHISQGISASGLIASRYFFSEENAEYLKHFGPVGARDLATLKLFEAAGVPAYFSGCMTLTLQPAGLERRDDVIVLVDVSDKVVSYVRKKTRKQIRLLSAFVSSYNPRDRVEAAREMLTQLETAHCVVTTRLHAALPSLALGTPIYLIDEADDQYRFDGLARLVRHGTEQEFLSGLAIDLDNPEPNAEAHRDIVAGLRKTVAAFVATDDLRPAVDLPLSRLNATLSCVLDQRNTIGKLEWENEQLKAQLARKTPWLPRWGRAG